MLKFLHSLGFKTFSSTIDESYDNADSIDRYKRVIDAAQELVKVHNNKVVTDVCKYNKNLLLSIDHKKKVIQDVFLNKIDKNYEQLTSRRI